MNIITNDKSIYAMSAANAPVLTVLAGSRVIFETKDCFGGQITCETDAFDGLDWGRINPATGPLYVEGAEIGDILSVTIEKIEIADKGVVACGQDMGTLGHLFDQNHIKILSIVEDKVIFSDDISFPINKMVGVIGTAPAVSEGEISCGTPCLHGGNLDCKKITEGATLLLPVNVSGALLAMGDLHAAMGDGEIGVSGLEVAGRVTVTVDVIKGKKLQTPMIFDDTHIMTIASHEDLDMAVDIATESMVKYLMEEKGMTLADATMLISLAGNVCICQVVDPKKTIRVEVKNCYGKNKKAT
ncbi:MAG: acetamidase/formamidase family protein [Defluviitaleaceae bacterium]|nr:acetamidase/formamidase family protein [Defluviitaleaceae bacterium]